MLDSMVDAVGIEPTTCRLRAVRFVLAPANTGCYKFLSSVWFTSSIFPSDCYRLSPDYDRF